MNIVARRRLWFGISLAMIIPGMISLALWGLKPGIDFRGGQEMELKGPQNQSAVRTLFISSGAQDVTVTTTGSSGLLVRYRVEDKDSKKVESALKSSLAKGNYTQVSFSSVGPSVSADITRNALISILLASTAILLYIAFAFRNAPPPVSSWNFGISAIIAMVHDALILIGLFSILGHFFGVQIDSLFVTAVLTTIGFSVHDTIVVFDRVRENARRIRNDTMRNIIDISMTETLSRTLITSGTTLITVIALFWKGGPMIHGFSTALLIGIGFGTYSSIYVASAWAMYMKMNREDLMPKVVEKEGIEERYEP